MLIILNHYNNISFDLNLSSLPAKAISMQFFPLNCLDYVISLRILFL